MTGVPMDVILTRSLQGKLDRAQEALRGVVALIDDGELVGPYGDPVGQEWKEAHSQTLLDAEL